MRDWMAFLFGPVWGTHRWLLGCINRLSDRDERILIMLVAKGIITQKEKADLMAAQEEEMHD